jgi:hypothetical protein
VVAELAVILPAQGRLEGGSAFPGRLQRAHLVEAALAVGLELVPAQGVFRGQFRGPGPGREPAAEQLLPGEGFPSARGLSLQFQQASLQGTGLLSTQDTGEVE